MPSSENARSNGNGMFRFIRHCQITFQNGGTILYAHQDMMWSDFSANLLAFIFWQILLLLLLPLSHSDRLVVISYYGFVFSYKKSSIILVNASP